MKILSNSIFLPLAFLAFVVAGQPSATLVADGVDVSSKHHIINDDVVASIDNNRQGRSLRGTTNGGNIGGTTTVTTTKFAEEIMGIIGSSHRELGSNCNGDCSSKRDRYKDCTETSHGNWVCQKKKRGNPCRYADPNPGKWYCNDCNHKTSNTYCCKGCGFY